MTTPTSSGEQAADGPAPAVDWEAGGLETELGWSLQSVFTHFGRTATSAVASVPGGPRGYQVLLVLITDSEAPSSQMALAQRLALDKTTVTYLVDALEQDGLVERRPDPKDRRVRQVLPTPAGREVLDAARQSLRNVEAALLTDLSESDQARLRRLLATVALRAGRAEPCAT